MEEPAVRRIVWRNVVLFAYLHLAAVYGLSLVLGGAVCWETLLFVSLLFLGSSLGVTAGCHRLWSHRSYRAKLPLRLLLAFFQTLAFQNSIHEWSRDHRVHHKFSETNADPHNAKRGFFFAHMGWLLVRKHPALLAKGRQLDLSDLEADPVVMFQKRHYGVLVVLVCGVMPGLVPFLWAESFLTTFFFVLHTRYCLNLHTTWLVNSAAHLWGTRPYDKGINPAENGLVALLALGEGWHNYHHTFSWDYKTAEVGLYATNLTSLFIDFMGWIGWAYDLKTVSDPHIRARAMRTGDGTHGHGPSPWGFGDKEIPREDLAVTEVLSRIQG